MTIDERIERLMQSIKSHDRQLGELTPSMTRLVETADRDEAMRTLARIAEATETS
jgi:hypothetical protein